MMNPSLALLGDIAVMAGAVAIPAAQGALNDIDESLYLQIAAAVTDAGALTAFGFGADADDDVLYLGFVLLIIQCLESMNGFGPPDTGDKFSHPASSSNISFALKNAAPTRWSGKAEYRYAGKNETQQDYQALFNEADKEIATTLTTQAGQVEQVREGLAGVQIAVVGAIGVAMALAVVVWALKDQGLLVQYEVVVSVLARFVEYSAFEAALAALGLLGWLIYCGQGNSGAFDRAQRKYRDVVDGLTAMIPAAAAVVEMPAVSVSGAAEAPGVPASILPKRDGLKQLSRVSRRAAKQDVTFADAFAAGGPWDKARFDEVAGGRPAYPRRVNQSLSDVPNWTT